MNLPAHIYVAQENDWQDCLAKLQTVSRIAIDLEANSMYAYRERVCLIQITIPGQSKDYIIDPETNLDLSGLGDLIADPAVEKIFHAAEYDMILMRQAYDWELNNLFDTMWAARILGYRRYGLASLLEELYDIKLDKRYQKSNWCKRPLSTDQLRYAQLDTHYLLRLRDDLGSQLDKAGRSEEAHEIFAEQTRIRHQPSTFHPDDFWSLRDVHDLNGTQQAVLKAINIFRDQEARRRDQPLFKIFGDRTLMELATKMPSNSHELSQVYGMSRNQVRRYSHNLLRVIQNAKTDPHPTQPPRPKRLPDAVVQRYERLHTWRKHRGQARGVESDVIISRDGLWQLAHSNPTTLADLADLDLVGEWRIRRYGEEILDVLRQTS